MTDPTPAATLPAAVAAHQQGRFAEAERLYRALIAGRPDHFDALFLLATLEIQNQRLDSALGLIDRAIAANRAATPAHMTRGDILLRLARWPEALASYDAALALAPDFAEAWNNRGVALRNMERLDASLESYDRALAIREYYAEAWTNRGVVLRQLNRPGEALASYDRALAATPDDGSTLAGRGAVLKDLGRLDEALASYDRALAARPRSAETWNNRGNLLREQRRFDDALASYDRALALQPAYGLALVNRGLVLTTLRRFAEALACYDQAIALNADDAEAWIRRGRVLIEKERPAEALSSFDRAIALDPGSLAARTERFSVLQNELKDVDAILESARANVDHRLAAGFGANPHWGAADAIASFRLEHDLEQATYLLERGRDFDGLWPAHDAMARIHADRANRAAGGDARIPMSRDEAAAVNRFRLALFISNPPDAFSGLLNPDNDWRAIEAQYFSRSPQILTIDNLLAPPALAALRQFCLESTVWKSDYANQYLGAFSSEGFISRLHLQIALDLRRRMPRIFGGLGLEDLWAFKYAAHMRKGINVHADYARVNLNFWITPDEAVVDTATGGLKVYDVPPPAGWMGRDYNSDAQAPAIYKFLAEAGARAVTVPHRCNRAVLFDSALFHETDEIHFKPGYLNRRINITYLFGRGLPV